MVSNKHGIYIAWNVFNDYAKQGSLILKEMVHHALDRLLPDKTLTSNLTAQGLTTLMEQKKESRLIHHSLYASPVKRGLIDHYHINGKDLLKQNSCRPIVIEDGPVSTIVEALFKYKGSSLCQRYILPKKGTAIQSHIRVY